MGTKSDQKSFQKRNQDWEAFWYPVVLDIYGFGDPSWEGKLFKHRSEKASKNQSKINASVVSGGGTGAWDPPPGRVSRPPGTTPRTPPRVASGGTTGGLRPHQRHDAKSNRSEGEERKRKAKAKRRRATAKTKANYTPLTRRQVGGFCWNLNVLARIY